MQELGCNVMLVRVLADATGISARALGPCLEGRLLRTILLPLLELLGAPCALMVDAADSALRSICLHSGYAPVPSQQAQCLQAERTSTEGHSLVHGCFLGGNYGLRELVGSNADYVVDALCCQLRTVSMHPRAPRLLAALLRHAGVAPEVMPLLAEPARASLKVGLSGQLMPQ
jgi:hypothetical protein